MRQLRSVESGDSSNSFAMEIQSHLGTHIDAPRHFFTGAQNIVSYSAGFFVFTKPYVLHVHLQPSELLNSVEDMFEIPGGCDLLLLKSGWTTKRMLPEYCCENPGISPELAKTLREKLPALRAIGVDWLSVSAYKYRDLGRETHRIFLNPDACNSPVLLIEDMDLSIDLKGLQRVIVAPLRVTGFDSAPCTVLGQWND